MAVTHNPSIDFCFFFIFIFRFAFAFALLEMVRFSDLYPSVFGLLWRTQQGWGGSQPSLFCFFSVSSSTIVRLYC